MTRAELKELTDKVLKKKEKSLRVLSYLFVPILIGLLCLFILSYTKGEGLNMPLLVIMISSFGGLVSVLPTLKLIQEEIKERSL